MALKASRIAEGPPGKSEISRRIRRVSHSPTGRPSRRAAALAASRASGGMPATFQGRSGRISTRHGPHPTRERTCGNISCKEWLTPREVAAVFPPSHAQHIAQNSVNGWLFAASRGPRCAQGFPIAPRSCGTLPVLSPLAPFACGADRIGGFAEAGLNVACVAKSCVMKIVSALSAAPTPVRA